MSFVNFDYNAHTSWVMEMLMSFVNFDYNAHTSWVMEMLMNVFCWPCLHKTRILCLENTSLRILGPPSPPSPIVGLFHWVGDVCVSLML
jgi:hypothetical protein